MDEGGNNMKDQMRNKLRDKAGFTLVELIVVIAILGILAGVGTVGYSGYIKKANQAADEQLLGAVNQAFAAACIENNVNFSGIATGGAGLTYTENGPVTGVTPVQGVTGNALTELNSDFLRYYAGNESAALKYYKAGEITFYAGRGFAGTAGLYSETFTLNGKTVTLTAPQAVIDQIKQSIWTSDAVGVNQLMTSVDNVTGLVKGLFGDPNVNASLLPVLTGNEFTAYMVTALEGSSMAAGFAGAVSAAMEDNPSLTEAEAKLQVTQQMIGNIMESAPDENQEAKKMIANTMVLYTAANSGKLVNSGWYESFKTNGGIVDTAAVQGVLNGTAANAETFAQLAAAYAMNIAYNGYVSQTEAAGQTAMGKTDYLASDQGYEAFNTYLSSMNLITSNCEDPVLAAEVLEKGFNSQELLAALNSMLGGN